MLYCLGVLYRKIPYNNPKFPCIRRLGPFLGFKILIFNIFGGFQKNKYFLGYGDFSGYFVGVKSTLEIFWGILKINNFLGS